MKYAKLTEGILEFAPQNKGAIINYNTNVELMKADGYKLFVEVEKPVTNRIYHIGYEEISNKIQEVIIYDETQEEADQREAQQETERINNLTMTPLDFIKVLQAFGLSLQKINEFLESNLDIKMQLTYCSNVYCGVVKSFLPKTIDELVITPEMVEQAFKTKNGVD